MALGGMEFYEKEYKRHLEAAEAAMDDGDLPAVRRNLLKSVEFLVKFANGAEGPVKEKRLELADKLMARAESIPKDAGARPGSPAWAREKEKKGEAVAPRGPNKQAEGKEDDVSRFVPVEKPRVRFGDIAGLEDVKEQIRLKMIYPFQHREAAERFRIRRGGGILLYGPPGTGKTLIARAVAGEIEAAFFTVKPAEIMSKWVGDSEGNVARLFSTAREHERSIIFLDEIEALVPRRRESSGAGGGVMARLVPQILAELEGFDTADKNPLLFMGATNEPWNLDPAILRPGRFDERVYIGLPDESARKQIFEINLKGRPLADDVDLAELATKSDGLSGADVKNICEKAAADAFLRAVRDGGGKPASESPPICKQDLMTALAAVRPSVSRDDLERFLRYRERPE